MANDTIQTIDIKAAWPGRGLDGNIWQRRSVDGQAIWSWITWAFTAYWVLFVAGAFLNRKELNAIGGVVVLGALAWVLVERLWVRLDAVVMASLTTAVCIPVLQVMVSSPLASEALFKHVSLCLVMAVARVLQVPAAFKSKMRWWLAAQVLTILLISFTIFKGASWDGGTRHSGLFVNPNNLALIPFLLLFFINPLKDKWFVRLGAHAIVVAVLAFSGTNGAVLAYAIGLAVHLSGMVSKQWRSAAYGLLAVGGLAAVTFLAMDGERFLPETRMTNQITVMRVQLKNVLEGGDVAYYEQERVLGPGSGLGHLENLALAADGHNIFGRHARTADLGFGIGSSPLILGKLPHNESLRTLFEQGLCRFPAFYLCLAPHH